MEHSTKSFNPFMGILSHVDSILLIWDCHHQAGYHDNCPSRQDITIYTEHLVLTWNPVDWNSNCLWQYSCLTGLPVPGLMLAQRLISLGWILNLSNLNRTCAKWCDGVSNMAWPFDFFLKREGMAVKIIINSSKGLVLTREYNLHLLLPN